MGGIAMGGQGGNFQALLQATPDSATDCVGAGYGWLAAGAGSSRAATVKLLSVSYDVTRELTFENETALIQKQFPADQFEVVVPSLSILAENPVAWVDKVTRKHGTQKAARSYLEYLNSDTAQEIAAAHYFRPTNPGVLAKYPDRFKRLTLFTVDEVLGSCQQAQQTHFADGGFFDQIYQPK